MNWDAELYLRFSDERTRPSVDLTARIEVADPLRVIDLGCGPGNSTAVLHRRWPKAHITGLDSSPDMIASAARSYPRHKWLVGDIAAWSAGNGFDVVFSNAALQWVPGHAVLFPRLFAQVASGGALAVQMPAIFNSAPHRQIFETANDPRWRRLMGPALNALTGEAPSFYYNLLRPLAARLDMWETEYYHIVESPQSIVEWFRGTGMRPFLDALENEEQRKRFEDRLRERYTLAYLPQDDGRILFPFRRLFIIAYRA
ncbi:MAG TPA: methyltransferase domain-containing protein [Syntrophobacteraceae bacterium]|nr:methyltransferase domain-containing protein [Syntrophobacteraceae bacterium]